MANRKLVIPAKGHSAIAHHQLVKNGLQSTGSIEKLLISDIYDDTIAAMSSVDAEQLGTFVLEHYRKPQGSKLTIASLYDIYINDKSLFVLITITDHSIIRRIWKEISEELMIRHFKKIYYPIIVSNKEVETYLCIWFLRLYVGLSLDSFDSSIGSKISIMEFMQSLSYTTQMTTKAYAIPQISVDRISMVDVLIVDKSRLEFLEQSVSIPMGLRSTTTIWNGGIMRYLSYPICDFTDQLDIRRRELEGMHMKGLTVVHISVMTTAVQNYYKALYQLRNQQHLDLYVDYSNNERFLVFTYGIMALLKHSNIERVRNTIHIDINNTRVTVRHRNRIVQDIIVVDGLLAIPIILSLVLYSKLVIFDLVDTDGYITDLIGSIVAVISYTIPQ